MARVIEGNRVDAGGRYAIVVARFNDFITERLADGALAALAAHGIDSDTRIDQFWVPGAFELPLVCQRVARTGDYAAVIAIGAVIRGSTSHFDFVAGEAAKGTTQASLAADIPVVFGVLTTDTIEQAIERAGTKAGNKGFEAGCTAIEMVSLLQRIEALHGQA